MCEIFTNQFTLQVKKLEKLLTQKLASQNPASELQNEPVQDNNDDDDNQVIDLDVQDPPLPQQVAKRKKHWSEFISPSSDEESDTVNESDSEGSTANYQELEVPNQSDDEDITESDYKPHHFTERESRKYKTFYYIKRGQTDNHAISDVTLKVYKSLTEANKDAERFADSLPGVERVSQIFTDRGCYYAEVLYAYEVPGETIYVCEDIRLAEKLDDIIKENEEKSKTLALAPDEYAVMLHIQEWPEESPERVGEPAKSKTTEKYKNRDVNNANRKAHDIFITEIQPNQKVVGANERYIREILPACKNLLRQADMENTIGNKSIAVFDDDEPEFTLTHWRHVRVEVIERNVEPEESEESEE